MTVRKNISLNYLNLDDAAEWPERTEEYHKMPERVRIAVFGLAIRSTPWSWRSLWRYRKRRSCSIVKETGGQFNARMGTGNRSLPSAELGKEIPNRR